MEMPSEIVMVLKMTALPPASLAPSAASRANSSMCMLQGVTWLQVEAIPICGLRKSSGWNPTAWSIARVGALSGPSTKGPENCLIPPPLFLPFIPVILPRIPTGSSQTGRPP